MKYVVLGLVLICFLLSSCSFNGSKNDERSTTTLLDISALRYNYNTVTEAPTLSNDQTVFDGRFSYEIKGSYSSRSDVESELRSLDEAYYGYIRTDKSRSLSDAQKAYNKQIYTDLQKKLWDIMENDYPLSREEVESSEHKAFDSIVEDMYYWLKIEGPTEDRDLVDFMKWRYAGALKLKEAFDNGEISYEEARERLRNDLSRENYDKLHG